ncbi:MAG: hypothetical protein MJ197_09720 [Bacteroidales bacterium]|nr:hypothetical protein [Bacteroidales bacterium]
MNELEKKDMYWASVSGGKDSLFMFRLILDNPEKYKLNGVVHFKLEIDFPWVDDVCALYKEWCQKLGIPYIEISPRMSWYDGVKRWGFPTRLGRWCNSNYKLDCRRQFEKTFKDIANIHWYVGFCADETHRFKNDIYPLAIENINESDILEWAKNVPVFNNYYKTCKRQGCMFCPLSSMIEKAYLKKYYPDKYKEMCDYVKDFENKKHKLVYHAPIDVINERIDKKWIKRVI